MDIENLEELIGQEIIPTSDELDTCQANLKILNYSFYNPNAINFISFNPEKKLVLVCRANSTLEI